MRMENLAVRDDVLFAAGEISAVVMFTRELAYGTRTFVAVGTA